MYKGAKMQKKNIRGISTALLVTIVLSGTSISFADKIEDLQKEQNEIKNEIQSNQEKLDKVSGEQRTVDEQIKDLDEKMTKASLELNKVEDDLVTIQEEIDKNLEELEEAERVLAEKQENFEARVNVMYMNGDVGYLELLLTSKDIKDFFSRKEMVKTIAKQDRELLESMKEQKELIEEKKKELDAQRASLAAAKTKLEARKNDLEVATREKQDLMSRLEQDIEYYQAQDKKFMEDADSIGAQILKLQEEQKAREEAQRLEREAAEAKKKQSQASKAPASSGDTNSSGNSSTSSSPSQAPVGGRMTWPVPSSGRISSPFGWRIHPIRKTKNLHTGLDIPAAAGSNVIAASSGTVIYSGWLGSYGNAVMIDHGGGIVTLYGHNSSTVVSVGQTVNRGAVVAKVGSTGASTGPHCHFEVRQNGNYINPLPWVR